MKQMISCEQYEAENGPDMERPFAFVPQDWDAPLPPYRVEEKPFEGDVEMVWHECCPVVGGKISSPIFA